LGSAQRLGVTGLVVWWFCSSLEQQLHVEGRRVPSPSSMDASSSMEAWLKNE